MLSIALNSTNLRTASYEVWSATLTVEFHSGAIYSYFHVPPAVADALASAPSPGRFHHQFIKNRYSFRRLN